jgi:hypothetical protein
MLTNALKKIDDQFELEHVGSSLLNELAKGLYQPESVIREYIQNAIDAHRLWEIETGNRPGYPIQVEYRGNGISILDYGIGMDLEEVRNVKSVAVSRKQNVDPELGLTGHKGVGIWAGLSFFEVLTLRTTKQGSDKGYQIILRFKNILEAIDEKTDIGKALNPNYEIHEFNENVEEHYTDITLSNPTQSADWFMNSDKVRDAIKRICPCKIDPNFVFHDEVENWYAENGFDNFSISLDGSPVYRDYVGNVDNFTYETFTIADKPVAKIWYAVTKKKMMKPSKDELIGFRIAQNGFVIGGTNPYSPKNLPNFESLSIGQYPYWYVGEIHVVSSELRPNLARNDFKESEIRRKFVQKIRKWYDELAVQGMILGQKRNRLNKYFEYQQTIKQIVTKGAPVVLDQTDKNKLIGIRTSLLKDEDLADEDKRGKSPKSAAPIDACRDKEVRSQRKALLTDINRMLSDSTETNIGKQIVIVDSEQEEDVKQVGTDDEKAASSKLSDRQEEKKPPPPSYVPRSFWDNEDDETEQPKQIAVEVVLSLLEEILREEFADDQALQTRIVDKLQTRINLVETNG